MLYSYSRKGKAGFPEEVLSEEIRIAMLMAMAEDDPRLEVSDVECRHPKWNAMETMRHFREVYPDAELYYLTGSDNLAMFLRSKRLAEFLENFHFAVVVRDGEDTTSVLIANEIAWERKDRYMSRFGKALNAGCMINGYRPVTLDELIENNMRFRQESIREEEV